MDKKYMLQMRLEGATYQDIANSAGITRQRVEQLLSPPKAIREYVFQKYDGLCAKCGIYVGKSGHIHHKNSGDEEQYQDIDNLELLCPSCHRTKHHATRKSHIFHINEQDSKITKIRKSLGLTQEEFAHKLRVTGYTIRRWESGKSAPHKIHREQLQRLEKRISSTFTK